MKKCLENPIESIGGFFGLELNYQGSFYPDAIELNSGRSAFEYILKQRQYEKILIPIFTCNAIKLTLKKLRIKFEKYSINAAMEPVLNDLKLGPKEALLYTNYFGLQNKIVNKLAKSYQNLIIDNAQAFFDRPILGVDTFYSPRKFFGVPDGGYAFTNSIESLNLSQGYSHHKFEHLLRRHDLTPQEAYTFFKVNESILEEESLSCMSRITAKMLNAIDYQKVKTQRQSNFKKVHSSIGGINELLVEMNDESAPLTYPFLCQDSSLRQRLLDQSIYTALYWPNVVIEARKDSIEYLYATQIVHLPIDQRYSEKDLDRLLSVIGK
jgi:hypothetical protein